jgi:hypothetical protein
MQSHDESAKQARAVYLLPQAGSFEGSCMNLPRYTPIRKVRKKVRPGRLRGEGMKDLRLLCYERDGRKCVECNRPVVFVPWSPMQEDGYHMAHIRNRRMWGDNLENVHTKCGYCHIVLEHRGGKVVAKKEAA